MKKYAYILAACAALVACAKEAVQEEFVSPSESNVNTVTFKATIEAPTKGTVANNGDFTWNDTDEIAVWTSAQKRTATATSISGSTAEFTFTLGEGETISDGAIVVYPASLLTAAGTVTFPTEYTAADAAKSNLALAAKVDGSALGFKYLGGVIEATITDVPAFATAIEVTSTSVLTGEHTVSFTGADPTMATSSTAKKVTVTPAGGSNTIVLPLPTAANGQAITFTVKKSDTELFSRTATKDVARGAYFKMANLTINPTVYIIANFTDWDYTNAYAMTGVGTTKSATLVSGVDKYYRYVVDFGSAQVDMGPSSDGSTALSETFVAAANASKITTYGCYDFTFDYTTNQNSVSASATKPQIYLTGTFQNPNAWQLNNDTPLTMVNNAKGYKVMNMAAGSEFKAYTNAFWNTAFPGKNVVLSSANYYIIIVNAEDETVQCVYADATSSEASSMTLKGSFDSWGSGLNMTQVDSSPFWYVDVNWASETQFKFFKDGTIWMANGGGCYTSVSITWSGDGNVILPAGKYRIIGSENQGGTGSFAILSLD